jgi:hypothetical protein
LLECLAVGKRVFSTFATTRIIRFIRESRCPPDYLLHWHKPFLLHSRSLNGSPFIAHGEKILYWGPASAKKAGKRGYDSFAFNSLWPRERKIEGIEAPTPKPVALFQAAMEFWLDPGDLVIDPFLGSGTTMVAAVRRCHRCIGVDTDLERVGTGCWQRRGTPRSVLRSGGRERCSNEVGIRRDDRETSRKRVESVKRKSASSLVAASLQLRGCAPREDFVA